MGETATVRLLHTPAGVRGALYPGNTPAVGWLARSARRAPVDVGDASPPAPTSHRRVAPEVALVALCLNNLSFAGRCASALRLCLLADPGAVDSIPRERAPDFWPFSPKTSRG